MPAQITDDAILVLHDEAMGNLLRREAWTFTEPTVLFTPLKAVPHS
jgi:urease accessory protein UreE